MADSPHTRMSREEQAEMEVGTTSVSRPLCFLLVLGFLLTAVGVPLVQHILEIRAGFEKTGHWVWPNAYGALRFPGGAIRAFRDPAHRGFWNRFQAANTKFMREVRAFEKALEEDSFLARATIPRTQAFTAEFLGLGNEQVCLGRSGWLFYQPDVAHLAGPGFLDPSILKAHRRAGRVGEEIQPDPIRAIVAFRDDLKARGIHLLLVPVPVKPMIEPEHLSQRFRAPLSIPLQNSSHAAFLCALDEAGVDCLDVSGAVASRKLQTGRSQFLLADTHWTPEGMERVAELMAERIRGVEGITGAASLELTRGEENVRGGGDIAAMLKLPAGSGLYPKQEVVIHPVHKAAGGTWTPEASAAVLLLGDSFSNIYSLEAMGWGASAGLAEQLSFQLRQPLDAILRNDAGAYATRELLARELAQGKNRLAGKKVVVWEFAMRELSVGDWKLIGLPTAKSSAAPTEPTIGGFFVPAPGETVEVEGTVQARSMVPKPGTVPYKDQIFSVHLAEIQGGRGQAVVYLSGMAENKRTPASEWKTGQRVKVRLRAWDEVAAQYERLNRSELDNVELQLESPCWGEPVTR